MWASKSYSLEAKNIVLITLILALLSPATSQAKGQNEAPPPDTTETQKAPATDSSTRASKTDTVALPHIVSPSQEYCNPLPGELALSGSFGEIRPRHYHGGLDLRTGSKEGMPVLAVADGYVSLVSIHLKGYGKRLHIQHPNGQTSVYAHLSEFVEPIRSWVKKEQYKQKSYVVDLFPDSTVLRVRKNDTIALSGNTGSSGGPHLHFELRDSLGYQLAPYRNGVPYIDTIAPTIRRLYIYPIDTNNFEATNTGRIIRRVRKIKRHGRRINWVADTLRVPRIVGLGIDVPDRINGGSLTCNIHSLDMIVDDNPIFHYDIDRVHLDSTATADGHIDLPIRYKYGIRGQFLFTFPGNTNSNYRSKGQGLIRSQKGQVHRILIIARDPAGNADTLRLITKGTGRETVRPMPKAQDTIRWEKGQMMGDSTYTLSIAPGSLLYDIGYRAYHTRKSGGMRYTTPIAIHRWGVPMRKRTTLTILKHKVPEKLRHHIYFATPGAKGWIYHSPAYWYKGKPYTELRSFGTFTLAADTTPPRITQLRGQRICHKRFKGDKTFELRVTDSQTPIKSVIGLIDGSWTLWEYEPKTHRIKHTLDPEYTAPGHDHNLRLEVIDACGNKAVLECPFRW